MTKKTKKLDSDIGKLIKIIIGLFIIVGVFYLVTIIMNKKGIFDNGYVKPNSEETIISYDFIPIGTVFNRLNEDYYVIFADFYEESSYIKSIIQKYEKKDKHIKLYKVDLNNGVNKSFISENTNPNVKKAKDIKVKNPTLIRITKHNNVKYIEDIEQIKKELLN